jgi:hypothetical protein
MMNFWFKKKCFTAKTREKGNTEREREKKREKIFFRFCLYMHLSLIFTIFFFFRIYSNKSTHGLELLYLYK